jgi:hypothetical protein
VQLVNRGLRSNHDRAGAATPRRYGGIMPRKPRTLEEIKRDIKDYKGDLNYCIDGLEDIKRKNYEQNHLDSLDAYLLAETQVHLEYQDLIIKDLLKIIKTNK